MVTNQRKPYSIRHIIGSTEYVWSVERPRSPGACFYATAENEPAVAAAKGHDWPGLPNLKAKAPLLRDLRSFTLAVCQRHAAKAVQS